MELEVRRMERLHSRDWYFCDVIHVSKHGREVFCVASVLWGVQKKIIVSQQTFVMLQSLFLGEWQYYCYSKVFEILWSGGNYLILLNFEPPKCIWEQNHLIFGKSANLIWLMFMNQSLGSATPEWFLLVGMIGLGLLCFGIIVQSLCEWDLISL